MDVKSCRLQKLVTEGDLVRLTELISSNTEVIEYQNSINVKSGDTPAILASRHGHLTVLKYLVDTFGGYILEQSNFDGKRPLHESSQHGHSECIRYLLSQGVEVNCLKRADWTPLMLACTKKDLVVIKTLVEKRANLSLRNKDGWNSFHIAAREGSPEILNFLLDSDKNVGQTVSKNGRTPLHTAALHGKVDSVKVILKRCTCDINVRDSCGSTPLMDSLRSGHIRVSEILLEHKANVAEEDNIGRQGIHLAAQAGCESSVNFLLDVCNIDINTRTTTSGMTLLHVAAKEGQEKMIEFLLKNGTDINAKDFKQRTALHFASGSQHPNCVRCLLLNGSTDSKDESGNLASDMAVKSQIKEMFGKIS